MKRDFLGYQCSICNTTYEPEGVTYTCPRDGGNLDVLLDIKSMQKRLDPRKLTEVREPSLWRYLPLLPVDSPGSPSTPIWAVGWTPVFNLERLGQVLGLGYLWLKDESRNPTASFKDRASALVVAKARQMGAQVVVTASTGNAGAALAGMAAAVGQKAIIFAPKTAPPAKIAQLLVYDAQVLLVEGTYDDAFDLTIQASQEFGWYCRNTGYNPFTAEGKKTAALEIWEWYSFHCPSAPLSKPLSIFVSVGDGNIISGIHKGFKDLNSLGWLGEMPGGLPRLFGVQAEGSAAIAHACQANTEVITPVVAQTLADSIRVDLPRDGLRAVRAPRQTAGAYILVSDQEILQAISDLGKVGVFAEPAGATAYAGLVRACQLGYIQPDDPVLVINTGSGLKDVKAAMQAVQAALTIEPTLQAVRRVVQL